MDEEWTSLMNGNNQKPKNSLILQFLLKKKLSIPTIMHCYNRSQQEQEATQNQSIIHLHPQTSINNNNPSFSGVSIQAFPLFEDLNLPFSSLFLPLISLKLPLHH